MPLRSNELRSEDNTKDIAFYGALCLFLSAIEYMIPKPLPFMRIGLANLPLMLALDILPLPAFFILVCIKVFGQALITGTLFSYIFLFSIAGTICSAFLMFGLRRALKQRVSFIGIGSAGAMVSCAAQLALAYFFVFRESIKYIAPVFLAVGLVTGIALGVFANKINHREHKEHREIDIVNKPLCNSKLACKQSSVVLFIIGLIVMLFILFIPSTELRVVIFLVLWLLAIIFKKKTNPLLTILFLLSIIAFNLIIPYGKVLFSIGFIKITSGALTAGVHRAVTFQALVMLSKLTIREDLQLPGRFGNLLSESLRIFSKMMNNKLKIKDMLLKNNNPC